MAGLKGRLFQDGSEEQKQNTEEVELPLENSSSEVDQSQETIEAEAETAPVAKKAKVKKSKGFVLGEATINLIPPAFLEATKARELKRRWLLANGVLLGASALAVSALFVSSLPAQSELSNALSANTQLEAALNEYQEINQALAQIEPTKDMLNKAGGNEIYWDSLIGSIESNLPSGTSLQSLSIATEGMDEARGAQLLISFSALSPLGYADTLAAVQQAPGVTNVQIGGMTSTGDSYLFSATLDYDSSIKTNRFPARVVETEALPEEALPEEVVETEEIAPLVETEEEIVGEN